MQCFCRTSCLLLLILACKFLSNTQNLKYIVIHSVSCNCLFCHWINISAPVLFHDDINQGCKTISDAFRIKCYYIAANIYYPFLFIVYRSILPKQWANGYLMAIFLIYEGSLSIKCCISHAPISLYDVTK